VLLDGGLEGRGARLRRGKWPAAFTAGTVLPLRRKGKGLTTRPHLPASKREEGGRKAGPRELLGHGGKRVRRPAVGRVGPGGKKYGFAGL
jgi:hypothetical protein